jgi:dihydroneopterin aldolase
VRGAPVPEAGGAAQAPLRLDEIQLRGLRFLGCHGVSAAERGLAQPFEVDLDLSADLSLAAASDQLEASIDYRALCEAVRSVLEGPPVALLERLAELVAEAALSAAGPAAKAVAVTVRKLRPPVPYDMASAGVSVYRRGRED